MFQTWDVPGVEISESSNGWDDGVGEAKWKRWRPFWCELGRVNGMGLMCAAAVRETERYYTALTAYFFFWKRLTGCSRQDKKGYPSTFSVHLKLMYSLNVSCEIGVPLFLRHYYSLNCYTLVYGGQEEGFTTLTMNKFFFLVTKLVLF